MEKRGVEAEEHEVSKNYEGRSKIMESSENMKMVDDTLYNRFFVIDDIIKNYDSTMQGVLKHPSKGARA